MLARNTFTLLTGNAASAVLSFVLSVLIGRALGQESLGIYAAALAWVFPLALLAEFGMGTLITRGLAGGLSPGDERRLLLNVALARLLLGGGIGAVVALGAPLLSATPQVQAGIVIAAPLILINPIYGMFTAVFRARRVMLPVALLNSGMLAAQVGLTAAVFAGGGGVLAALGVNTLTSAGQMVCAGLWWWRRWGIPPADGAGNPPGGAGLWALLRQSAPFALAAVLAAVQLRLGIILLERLSGAEQTGYFVAATRFMEGGRLLPFALFDALFPALSALVTQADAFRRTFARSNRALLIFGVAFGAGVTLTAPLLIEVTYGAGFAEAQAALVVLAWSLLPMTLKYARGLYWYAHGREGLVNRVTLAALAFQLALSVAVLPAYGAVGAAGVALVSECVALALLYRRR